ncbi:MAG: autotransporter assembly complex protein TamA [Pikeienuella sp.]|uniref:autotransporter assembly complex protein TamA n=1 Tax=Pikeienuella sp. TaxID=2831957 RepID=UPI00391CA818
MSRLGLLLGFLLLSACAEDGGPPPPEFARPETALDYAVAIEGVEREGVVALMEQALELYRQQDRGAQSLAFLRRRAEGDMATVLKIMRSDGYFEAEARYGIEEVAPEAPADNATETPAEEEAKTEAPGALVRIVVTPNRRYTLAAHRFQLLETGPGEPPAAPDAGLLGSPVGGPARADRILDAESAAVEALRASGRPYASRLGRDAVADPETAEIEVETAIAAGRAHVFGPVTYVGLEDVDPDYLDTYLTFAEGDVAEPAKLVAFQRALISTNLFAAGSATLPPEPPEAAEAPVTVTLEEAPFRTISAGALYSTDAGPALTGGFEHRNLFGANETVTLEALAGLEEQSLDTRYRIPQLGRPGQDLVFGAEARRIDDDAFDEIGGTLFAGLERELSEELTVGAGILLELSRLDEGAGVPAETSRLFGLPVFAAIDATDDRLDPSNGFRARAAATPFSGVVGNDPAAFMILDASTSAYFDLTGEKKYILAARGRLGSILAGDLDVVSVNRRLFSGGGGSVRGYAERFIGPLDANNDPTGGLSVAELGAELRARVSETVGLAGFVEAGSVSEELFPDFDEGVQVAIGGGVRYFSPVGPLRVDVGVPVNPRGADDAFQVYISIGQAF